MKRVFIGFLCLLVLVLVGCSASDSSTTSPGASLTPAADSSNGVPQAGGVITFIGGTSPVAFGYPPASSPLDNPGHLGILEALIGVDGNGDPTPKLATDWKISEDGKTVTFILRQGVKFHDGTDFNADAVKWNMDLAIEAKLISAVTSVEVVDSHTVNFILPQYSSVVFTQVSDQFYISPTAVQQNGVDWAKTHAVGTGPFMQKEFKRDASFTKVRFPDYWDKPKPYLDGLNHIFIPDATSAKIAFESGQGQILQLGDTKAAIDLESKGYIVRSFDGISNLMITDSANPESPFSNPLVRQALSYAIDRKAICQTVGSGYWKPTNQIIPSGWVGHNPDLPELEYNPDKGRELLTQAGYPDGFTTTLMGIQAFTNTDLVTALQANLKDIGIETTVDLMDFGRGFATQQQGWTNGIMISGTGIDPNMIQRMAVDLGKGNYPTTARPAEWYTLLEQADAARDSQTRGQVLQQLMKVTMDEMFVVPLYVLTDMAALDKSVNCDLLTYHHVKWNPAGAWLSK